MQINVSQLLKGDIGAIRNYEIDEAIEIEGCEYQVRGTAGLMRTDRGILVRGTLGTDTFLTCSRCLNSFACPLTMEIEEEYFPAIDVLSGSPLPPPEDPGAFKIDEHNILDLTEAIRQYASLAIPMKPLCRPNCAGLCPSCGANLNQARCSCPVPHGDPRWEALRKLALTESESPVVSEAEPGNSKGRK